MLIPTTVLPTIGGIHFNTHSGLGFTLRYFDQKFYVMLPSFRVGRVLPINPKNNMLPLRCFKGNRKCKAKAKVKFFDNSLLHDFEKKQNPNTKC